MTIKVNYIPTYRRYVGAQKYRHSLNAKHKLVQHIDVKLIDITDIPF